MIKLESCEVESRPMVGIAIVDSGPGILPEHMSKLFEPLFTTKPRGIGLGLAVCKKLVDANGGRIEVQSELGKGATFKVCLPVHEEMV
jgi:signal transduction histidine kinase